MPHRVASLLCPIFHYDDARVLMGWGDEVEGRTCPPHTLLTATVSQITEPDLQTHTVDISTSGLYPTCPQLMGRPMSGWPICVHRKQFSEQLRGKKGNPCFCSSTPSPDNPLALPTSSQLPYLLPCMYLHTNYTHVQVLYIYISISF